MSGLIRRSSVGPGLLKEPMVTEIKFPLLSILASLATATTKLFLEVDAPLNISYPDIRGWVLSNNLFPSFPAAFTINKYEALNIKSSQLLELYIYAPK